MLAETVRANGERIDRIDEGGTRGVGSLSVQMSEVIKDVAEARQELGEFRREHGRQHERETSARVVTRRWFVGTIIAALVAIEGPLAWVIVHVR